MKVNERYYHINGSSKSAKSKIQHPALYPRRNSEGLTAARKTEKPDYATPPTAHLAMSFSNAAASVGVSAWRAQHYSSS